MIYKQPISIIDLETTGVIEEGKMPKITQIGIVKWRGGNSSEVDVFHSYINPEEKLSDFIKSYTGITDEMLVDKPKFSEIVDDIVNFCQGTTLAAWPISFDITLLQYHFGVNGHKFSLDRRAIDLGSVCRFIMESNSIPLIKPSSGFSLSNVGESLGINMSGTRHNALDDAQYELDVFLRCLEINRQK